ncbi:NTP pyrophosphohydrolase [Lentzea sp. NPDC006480]|uniref:NTP pyrophosphohydrolase n=1 Tax=Lentzea sp. NPDC006480 TaxID=3157176 RepID=UPI0033A16338
MKPLLVVDAANVVGSVPDGWWRDRAGAAERLRDALQGRDEEVVLVVEGKARNVSSIDDVRVVAAPGDGDDTIVEVVRTEGAGRPVTVVTADRELRRRVTALGAEVAGPTSVPRR